MELVKNLILLFRKSILLGRFAFFNHSSTSDKSSKYSYNSDIKFFKYNILINGNTIYNLVDI